MRHWIISSIIIATLAVYLQVANHDFIVFDDDQYVTDNPVVKQGITLEGIRWAFTSIHASNWHPLTWLSHMLDCELFGLHAGAHHLINVALHLLNTFLLFHILHRMTGALWSSGMVAAIFALHPLHVESVAWIAERKDLLSTFFGLLTIRMYAAYADRPGKKRYGWVVLFFGMSLLAKPMLVTLPCLLLLLDYWPLGRMRLMKPARNPISLRKTPDSPPFCRIIWEKLPLLTLSAVSSLATYWAQSAGASVTSISSFPIHLRISNALLAYCRYIEKAIFPYPLAIFYPLEKSIPFGQAALAGILLVAVTFLVCKRWRTNPYLLVGWFWYQGTLVPVIGLVQVGAQSMADRYTYIPMVGLLIILAWGVPDLLQRLRYKKAFLAGGAAAILITCTILTWFQVQLWRDSVALFGHTLVVANDSPSVHNNLGNALAQSGRYQEALFHFNRAIQIHPQLTDAHYNKGSILLKMNMYAAAEASIRLALSLYPDYPEAHNNLGLALAAQNRLQEAAGHYQEALRLNPTFSEALMNWGNIFSKQSDYENAQKCYENALRIQPNAAGHLNLGQLHAHQGRLESALTCYEQAISLDPDNDTAHLLMGKTYFRLQDMNAAEKSFLIAVQHNNGSGEAYNYLGRINGFKRKPERAREYFEKAIALNPFDGDSRFQLGITYATQGNLEKAIHHFKETIRLSPNHLQARRSIVQAAWLSGDRETAYAELEILRKQDYESAYQLSKWLQQAGGR